MAIGVCPQCRRRFVVEDARSFQRTCPACLRPMELPDAPDGPASDAAAGADEMLWFNGAPLVTDDLGQRVMGAIGEAASRRSVARAQREPARRQRGQESPVR